MTLSRLAFLLPALLPLPLVADDLPVITIRTPAGQMKYDRPVITATPGTQVKLVFENLDEMPHNFVLCHPLPDKKDKGLEVAQLEYQRVLCEQRGDMSVAAANHLKLCGAQEFIHVFWNLSETQRFSPVEKMQNLKHDA